jgi:hypothetical protein
MLGLWYLNNSVLAKQRFPFHVCDSGFDSILSEWWLFLRLQRKSCGPYREVFPVKSVILVQVARD